MASLKKEKSKRAQGAFNAIQIVEKYYSVKVAIPKDLLKKFLRQCGNALKFTDLDIVNEYRQASPEIRHVKVSILGEHEKNLRGFVKKFGDQNNLECSDLSSEFHRKIA